MKFKSERTYTVNQTARLLKIAPHIVLKYLLEGRIVGEKHGGQWLISESALAEFASMPSADFVHRVLPMLSADRKPKE